MTKSCGNDEVSDGIKCLVGLQTASPACFDMAANPPCFDMAANPPDKKNNPERV
ncbi:hypothetical protein [Neisseria lactamica]